MNTTITTTLVIFLFFIQNIYPQSNGQLYVPEGIVNTSLPGDRTTIGMGIGVPAPEYTLDIQGEDGTYINIRPTGGTEYGRAGFLLGPSQIVLLRRARESGDLALAIDNPGRSIEFGNNGGFSQMNFGFPKYDLSSMPKGRFNFKGNVWLNDTLIIGNQFGTNAYVLPEGYNVGIDFNTSFSNYVGIGGACIPEDTDVKLGVKGKVLCEGMKVKLAGDDCWADFVFDKNYKLSPLIEVEKYIKKNNHLPGIPSASEVLDNGLNVEEMLKLQMQKIEELTLYIIEQQKEIEKLKAIKY